MLKLTHMTLTLPREERERGPTDFWAKIFDSKFIVGTTDPSMRRLPLFAGEGGGLAASEVPL